MQKTDVRNPKPEPHKNSTKIEEEAHLGKKDLTPNLDVKELSVDQEAVVSQEKEVKVEIEVSPITKTMDPEAKDPFIEHTHVKNLDSQILK